MSVCGGGRGRGSGGGSGVQQHLLVALQLPDKCPLVEERLQPLLGVVVAELLERGPPLLLRQPGVLETRSVDDQQGAQRVLTGLQSSEETGRYEGYALISPDKDDLCCCLTASTSSNIWQDYYLFLETATRL